ncbi:MAG: diaminopimelate epimerase [Planctomycetales bacterium]
MRFTKMHGAGNDYVYVDCFRETVPADPAALAELARRISDRHTGVGGDGLILIGPSTVADARMRTFNADGSEAEMCGNGVRCVAKYLHDHGLARRGSLRIETARGTLDLDLRVAAGCVQSVRVNMGRPILEGDRIPTTLPGNPPIDVVLELPIEPWLAKDQGPSTIDHRPFRVTCISMGNPHCVLFVDEPSDAWVLGAGPRIERHPAFPRRVNAEFVQVLSPREIRLRVWERGAGETRACGTGACAAAVAGALSGRTTRRVLAHLPGGDLDVEWSASGDVFLTGPAVEVFSGDWPDSTTKVSNPCRVPRYPANGTQ